MKITKNETTYSTIQQFAQLYSALFVSHHRTDYTRIKKTISLLHKPAKAYRPADEV